MLGRTTKCYSGSFFPACSTVVALEVLSAPDSKEKQHCIHVPYDDDDDDDDDDAVDVTSFSALDVVGKKKALHPRRRRHLHIAVWSFVCWATLPGLLGWPAGSSENVSVTLSATHFDLFLHNTSYFTFFSGGTNPRSILP